MSPEESFNKSPYHLVINSFPGKLFIKESEVQQIISAGEKIAAQLDDEIKAFRAEATNLRQLFQLATKFSLKIKIISPGLSSLLPLALSELNIQEKEIKINRQCLAEIRNALKLQAVTTKTVKLCEIVMLHEILHFYLCCCANVFKDKQLIGHARKILIEEVAISELIKGLLPLSFNPILIPLTWSKIRKAPAARHDL